MAKFRKKPVVIEAEQWTGGPPLRGMERSSSPAVHGYYVVRTLEGEMIVRLGDWIITGIKGERYPCKPDIFEATYEPVAE